MITDRISPLGVHSGHVGTLSFFLANHIAVCAFLMIYFFLIASMIICSPTIYTRMPVCIKQSPNVSQCVFLITVRASARVAQVGVPAELRRRVSQQPRSLSAVDRGGATLQHCILHRYTLLL